MISPVTQAHLLLDFSDHPDASRFRLELRMSPTDEVARRVLGELQNFNLGAPPPAKRVKREEEVSLLLDLPDELFNQCVKALSIGDLCTLAQCHDRLRKRVADRELLGARADEVFQQLLDGSKEASGIWKLLSPTELTLPGDTEITDEVIDAIVAKKETLRSLDLSGSTGLTAEHLSRLTELSHLDTLNLAECELECDDLTSFAGFSKLKRLDLSSNDIGDRGFGFLEALTELEELSISDNDLGLAGARSISKLVKLQKLLMKRALRQTRIPGECMELICSLPELRVLNVKSNFLDSSDLSHLQNLTQLQVLKAADNEFGDQGAHFLRALTSLRILDLRANGLGTAAAVAIGTLRELEVLDLGNDDEFDQENEVGDQGIAALSEIATLRELHISGNGLQTLPNLRSLENLKVLDLANNDVDQVGAVEIGKLVLLETLGLRNNQSFDAHAAAQLVTLSKLQDLDLLTTSVGDEGVEHLKRLPELRILDLWNAGITEVGFGHLSTMGSLASLSLSTSERSLSPEALRLIELMRSRGIKFI